MTTENMLRGRPAIITAVNNDSMMMLSQALHQPIYETYAVRNLSMTLSYIEPDGSIFTENSTRFDKDLRIYPRYYYWQYLTLGHKYERADFLQTGACHYGASCAGSSAGAGYSDSVYESTGIDSGCRRAEREKISLPSRFFQETGAVRDNTSDRSITILAHHPAFLHMQYRNIRIAVELLGSFFEHRGFVGDDISQTGNDEYTLCQSMIGWYYLPFETRPQTSDWWAMDNCKRPMRTGPTLKLQTKIALSGERLALSIRANGVEDAPVPASISRFRCANALFKRERRGTFGRAGEKFSLGRRFMSWVRRSLPQIQRIMMDFPLTATHRLKSR